MPTSVASRTIFDDLESEEQALTLPAAARHPLLRINGKSRNASTLWRWASHGAPSASGTRVKLETARVGSRVITTASALGRFVRALSSTDAGTTGVSPADVRRAHRDAERQLDEIGL